MKYIISLFLILPAAANVTGQGTVLFHNSPSLFTDSATVDRWVYLDSVGGTKLVGTNFVAQLWYGSDPDHITEIADPVARFRPPTTSSPGTWSGSERTLIGYTIGQTATLQVRVWDESRAATFADAMATPGVLYGASTPFSYTVPGPFGPPDDTLKGLRAFALVPEPSPMLLIIFATLVFPLTQTRLFCRNLR
jgi:hypothetical protein